MVAFCTTTLVVSKSTLKSKAISISRLLEVWRQEKVEKDENKNKPIHGTTSVRPTHSSFMTSSPDKS